MEKTFQKKSDLDKKTKDLLIKLKSINGIEKYRTEIENFWKNNHWAYDKIAADLLKKNNSKLIQHLETTFQGEDQFEQSMKDILGCLNYHIDSDIKQRRIEAQEHNREVHGPHIIATNRRNHAIDDDTKQLLCYLGNRIPKDYIQAIKDFWINQEFDYQLIKEDIVDMQLFDHLEETFKKDFNEEKKEKLKQHLSSFIHSHNRANNKANNHDRVHGPNVVPTNQKEINDDEDALEGLDEDLKDLLSEISNYIPKIKDEIENLCRRKRYSYEKLKAALLYNNDIYDELNKIYKDDKLVKKIISTLIIQIRVKEEEKINEEIKEEEEEKMYPDEKTNKMLKRLEEKFGIPEDHIEIIKNYVITEEVEYDDLVEECEDLNDGNCSFLEDLQNLNINKENPTTFEYLKCALYACAHEDKKVRSKEEAHLYSVIRSNELWMYVQNNMLKTFKNIQANIEDIKEKIENKQGCRELYEELKELEKQFKEHRDQIQLLEKVNNTFPDQRLLFSKMLVNVFREFSDNTYHTANKLHGHNLLRIRDGNLGQNPKPASLPKKACKDFNQKIMKGEATDNEVFNHPLTYSSQKLWNAPINKANSAIRYVGICPNVFREDPDEKLLKSTNYEIQEGVSVWRYNDGKHNDTTIIKLRDRYVQVDTKENFLNIIGKDFFEEHHGLGIAKIKFHVNKKTGNKKLIKHIHCKGYKKAENTDAKHLTNCWEPKDKPFYYCRYDQRSYACASCTTLLCATCYQADKKCQSCGNQSYFAEKAPFSKLLLDYTAHSFSIPPLLIGDDNAKKLEDSICRSKGIVKLTRHVEDILNGKEIKLPFFTEPIRFPLPYENHINPTLLKELFPLIHYITEGTPKNALSEQRVISFYKDTNRPEDHEFDNIDSKNLFSFYSNQKSRKSLYACMKKRVLELTMPRNNFWYHYIDILCRINSDDKIYLIDPSKPIYGLSGIYLRDHVSNNIFKYHESQGLFQQVQGISLPKLEDKYGQSISPEQSKTLKTILIRFLQYFYNHQTSIPLSDAVSSFLKQKDQNGKLIYKEKMDSFKGCYTFGPYHNMVLKNWYNNFKEICQCAPNPSFSLPKLTLTYTQQEALLSHIQCSNNRTYFFSNTGEKKLYQAKDGTKFKFNNETGNFDIKKTLSEQERVNLIEICIPYSKAFDSLKKVLSSKGKSLINKEKHQYYNIVKSEVEQQGLNNQIKEETLDLAIWFFDLASNIGSLQIAKELEKKIANKTSTLYLPQKREEIVDKFKRIGDHPSEIEDFNNFCNEYKVCLFNNPKEITRFSELYKEPLKALKYFEEKDPNAMDHIYKRLNINGSPFINYFNRNIKVWHHVLQKYQAKKLMCIPHLKLPNSPYFYEMSRVNRFLYMYYTLFYEGTFCDFIKKNPVGHIHLLSIPTTKLTIEMFENNTLNKDDINLLLLDFRGVDGDLFIQGLVHNLESFPDRDPELCLYLLENYYTDRRRVYYKELIRQHKTDNRTSSWSVPFIYSVLHHWAYPTACKEKLPWWRSSEVDLKMSKILKFIVYKLPELLSTKTRLVKKREWVNKKNEECKSPEKDWDGNYKLTKIDYSPIRKLMEILADEKRQKIDIRTGILTDFTTDEDFLRVKELLKTEFSSDEVESLFYNEPIQEFSNAAEGGNMIAHNNNNHTAFI